VLVSIAGDKKIRFLEALKKLDDAGWDLYATEGTHTFLSQHGIASRCVYKAREKFEPNVATLISSRSVDLILNIPQDTKGESDKDGFTIRRLSIDHHIPLITNMQLALTFLQSLIEIDLKKLPVYSLKNFVHEKCHS
jgi:hypothetical protein